MVRGQSYYTGTIFEVVMDDFGGSVAGGGRYDKMIGKFTARIRRPADFQSVLRELLCFFWKTDMKCPEKARKRLILWKKHAERRRAESAGTCQEGQRRRKTGSGSEYERKNKKFQKEQLMGDGYETIIDCYADSVDKL